jgi:hypothetical protein
LKQYFKSEAWGFYDSVMCLMCLLSLSLHALAYLTGSALEAATQTLVSLSPATSNPIRLLYSLADTASFLESCACVLVIVRLLKFADAVPVVGQQLHAAAAAAAAAAKRMVSAAIMFVVITIGFASAACAAFGSTLQQWSTVWEAMRSLLTMLFGRCSLYRRYELFVCQCVCL